MILSEPAVFPRRMLAHHAAAMPAATRAVNAFVPSGPPRSRVRYAATAMTASSASTMLRAAAVNFSPWPRASSHDNSMAADSISAVGLARSRPGDVRRRSVLGLGDRVPVPGIERGAAVPETRAVVRPRPPPQQIERVHMSGFASLLGCRGILARRALTDALMRSVLVRGAFMCRPG
jgi:hypothetical protein